MIIQVQRGYRVALLEPDDTRRFMMTVPISADHSQLEEALRGIAEIDGTHAWVSECWVRTTSGRQASTDWNEAFDAMLAFARRKGWIRPADGAIRAHVEEADP